MKAILILCMVALLSQSLQAAPEVVLASGHEGYPPSMWRKGDQIIGIGAELTTLIFQDLGIQVESRYVGNWKRVQSMARNGELDVIVAAYKTQDREEYLDYTNQPFMQDPTVVWVKKGREFTFRQWKDLIGKKGGAILGDSYGEKFDLFSETYLQIDRVPKTSQNYKKLMLGRIDYIPYGLYSGYIDSFRLGYEGDITYLPTPIATEGLYIAVSKESPYKEHLPAINALIQKYLQDGTIERIIDKYLHEYTSAL